MTSPYQTAVAIKNELTQGNIEESTTGIEELIDALSRSDKRALRNQLIRLMMHIIIFNAGIEIEEILEEEPYLKPQAIRMR